MGTGTFLGVSCGRGVTLTPHPLLVPRSKIESSYISTLLKGLHGLWKSDTYLQRVQYKHQCLYCSLCIWYSLKMASLRRNMWELFNLFTVCNSIVCLSWWMWLSACCKTLPWNRVNSLTSTDFFYSFLGALCPAFVRSRSLSVGQGASSVCGWSTGAHMWRAAANASNKQSRTANGRWSSRLIFERGANNPKPWRVKSYETETTA